ncbi:MAG TPA: hypothetical protein VGZ73_31390 [Bryobacteraceae bacterium]|jgi:hypothetical protein|nr:hypothetical protein [Bryobacteraceae bacterium]
MTKKLLFVTTILLVVAFVAVAADVSGKWTYEGPPRGGNPGRPTTITLKAEGMKLTGTVPGGGGKGAPPTDVEITNGKVDGNNISFEVKRSTPNGDIVTKYEGTLSGDELKLKITRPAMGGGDPPPPYEVTAKRATS